MAYDPAPNEVALPLPRGLDPVAVAVGALIAVLAVGVNWALPAFAIFGGGLALLAIIDLRELRIPNRITVPMALVAFPLLALERIDHAIADASLLRGLLAGLALMTIYLVFSLASRGQLGMGDAKLGFLIGAHLGFMGWWPIYVATLVGTISIASIGLALLALGLVDRGTALPFGPALVVGAFVALFLA